jgi:hypothetical protein
LPEQLQFFICHASEDKEKVVRSLVRSLQDRGASVWYDEFAMSVGDSIRRNIDEALASAKYGIVVLSPSFLKKEWPKRELDGLVAREIAERRKIILPVYHEVTAHKVARFLHQLLISFMSRPNVVWQRLLRKFCRFSKRIK